MPQLSAIVITRNEAANIGACLDGLAFCDERIVGRLRLTDNTVEIAKRKGARVEVHEWRGFGRQKNFALSLATGSWVLSIDADERVTSALASEIKATVAYTIADGFRTAAAVELLRPPDRHSAGIPIMCCGCSAAAKRGFDDAVVHERVICEGTVQRLKEPVIHHPVQKTRRCALAQWIAIRPRVPRRS